MKVQAREGRVTLDLDLMEAGHLLSILSHAKFSNDVRMEIVGAPIMRSLLEGLMQEHAGGDSWCASSPEWEIDETLDGRQAPTSFEIIEYRLRQSDVEDFDESLAEHLFPYKWKKRQPHHRWIEAGRRIASGGDNYDYGISLDCWSDPQTEQYNVLVAWFKGEEKYHDRPMGTPDLKVHSSDELIVIG